MSSREKSAWDLFAQVFIPVLGRLAVRDMVRLEAWTTMPDGVPKLTTYVYVLRHTHHRVRIALAGGNAVRMGKGRCMSFQQEARLAAAGWQPPGFLGGVDHYIDGDFADVAGLGAKLLAALRQVWPDVCPQDLIWIGPEADEFAAIQWPCPSLGQLGA